VGAWLTTESDQWLSVHVYLGYQMLGLLGFRVLWGLLGTHYARFSSFWFGPAEAWAYLRTVLTGTARRHIGHNPTGSVAIYLLLLLVLVVGVSGFFTLGSEEQQGMAASWLNLVQGRGLKKLHELSAMLMLLLVIAHLSGVVVESFVHRENLARSMLTGTKQAGAGVPAARPSWGVAILLLTLILGFCGWWFLYALPPALGDDRVTGKPRVRFVGAKLPDNALWREECSSCHVVYHPSLLPSRSWKEIMVGQASHFGSDLALDPATTAAIQSFLTSNSAEQHATEAAFKIDRSLPPGLSPLRVTETPYWVKKHSKIAPVDWQMPQVKSKSNCAACHLDADASTFLDAAMRIPVRSASTVSQPKPVPQ
jgi:cytochrome b